MKGLILIDAPAEGAGEATWSRGSRALAPIINRPLLAHVLETLRAVGVTDVAVLCPRTLLDRLRGATVGHDAQTLRWIETTGSGAAGAILDAQGFLGDDRFVVHSTDGLWLRHRDRLVRALRASHDSALVSVIGPSSRGPLRTLPPGSASDPTAAPFGIGCFGPEMVDVLRRLQVPHRSLAHGLATLAREGGSVQRFPADGWNAFSGSAGDLLALNRLALEDLPDTGQESPPGADSHITGRVVMHVTARICRSIIRGPALIGARTSIADAYIGPYTVVGDDGVVENAEVEATVLLAGASLTHTGVRIESSVIGCGASVSRSFHLPRALRLVLGDDAAVELC